MVWLIKELVGEATKNSQSYHEKKEGKNPVSKCAEDGKQLQRRTCVHGQVTWAGAQRPWSSGESKLAPPQDGCACLSRAALRLWFAPLGKGLGSAKRAKTQ